jgi:hypothetical protein
MLSPEVTMQAKRLAGSRLRNSHVSLVMTLHELFELRRRGLLSGPQLQGLSALASGLRVMWSNSPNWPQDPDMFPERVPYARAALILEDVLPGKVRSKRGQRPWMTAAERDWIVLNPEGLTSDGLATALGRSPNAVFKVREQFRKQAGVTTRSRRGGSLDHLEPVRYAHRHEAVARWNELFGTYDRDAAGLVPTSGPKQLMPLRF